MPGYQLIEERYLSPPKQNGISRNTRRIGFLDFIRELKQEEFPYSEYSRLLVVGLEDVLLFSRPQMNETAMEIRKIIQSKAGQFTGYGCDWVQIMFRNRFVRGENLVVIHPAVVLPVYLIFGSPVEDVDENENVCYRCSFNLSG